MKNQTKHPTTTIAIKYGIQAKVDLEIVPLVNWLNAFPSVVSKSRA